MKLPPRNAMVQLTDPDTGKTRKMRALGQAARRIYRKQILAGTDPAFVLPRELRWQPDGSGGGRIFARPAAEIQKRQAYKSYLSSHQLNNTEQLPGLVGFGLLFDFRSVLEGALAQHGGIKWNATARWLMKRELNGEVIQQQDSF